MRVRDRSACFYVIHGILLIDKPEGFTSNDVVSIIRKRLNRSVKVGHSGTLDPAASGLLVMLLGTATRALDFLDETRKHYQVTIRLGEESDTCDKEGNITITGNPQALSHDEINACLNSFLGPTDQIPPHFSAIKKDGIPLYKLARKGVFPELEIRKIQIYQLSILEWRLPDLSIDLICSKGTYARALARDIGVCLGVGGRVETLRRVGSGKFHIENAQSLDSVRCAGIKDIRDSLIQLGDALDHLPEIRVSANDFKRLALGGYIVMNMDDELVPEIDTSGTAGNVYRVQDNEAQIIVLVRREFSDQGMFLKPTKVFNLNSQSTIE